MLCAAVWPRALSPLCAQELSATGEAASVRRALAAAAVGDSVVSARGVESRARADAADKATMAALAELAAGGAVAPDTIPEAAALRLGRKAADQINSQHFGADARVGLVLAGGGAKGLYHIGVIRALEENGIPIDYISGTSMGAIVAALYASGYSPDEMTAIVASGDVERWISGRIDDKYRFYYTERADGPTMLSVYAEMKRDSVSNKNSLSLALPHAFINTAQIDLALTGLFAPASTACGGDFDRLMVPFRCVATDMNGHRAVEFSKGDLPLVVRASMAYPLAFRPVTTDGMVLVDGGCYNNFPWQVLVDDFGPDFLIGSQCVGDDEYATQDSSVEQQVMALITSPTDYVLPSGRSVLIKREVDAGILDFAAGMEIIEQGYEDAMTMMPELMARLDARRPPSETAARREAFRARCPELEINDFTVEGLRKRQSSYARTFMHFDERPGDDEGVAGPFDFETVKERYYSLMATDEFTSSAFPRVRYDSVRQNYDLTFYLESKPRWRFLVGGNISSTVFNQAYLGFNYFSVGRTAQYAHGDLYLSPVSVMAGIGGRTVILKRRPMYVDYEMTLSHRTTLHGTFGNITPVRNSMEARTNEIFFHTAFGVAMTRKSIVEASLNTGFNYYGYQAVYDPIDTPHTHDRFRFVAGRVALERSTLDKVIYPTRGTRLSLSGIAVHGRDTYENAATRLSGRRGQELRTWFGGKVQWEHYPGDWQRSWFSMGYNIEAVYTNHPRFGNTESTILTSPRYAPISHSKMIYMPDYFADRYLAGGLMPTFELMRSFYLRASFYAMLRDRTTARDYMRYISDLTLVYHTRIGPVSLSLTKYDLDSWNNMYVTFNFGYPIFGRKALYY